MIERKLTYTDFDGKEREEVFRFHLTEAELTELDYTAQGGLESKVKQIMETQNGGEIITLFKQIILMSYGVKSPDGRRFIKNDEVRNEFAQTQAFSDLFMELATDADAANVFIKGLLPQKVQGQLTDEVINKLVK